MTVATSLMFSENMNEINNQQKAISILNDMGIRVIACNVEEEIINLKLYFDGIEFVKLDRSGKETAGKPFPYIFDILQVLKKQSTDNEICGIMNSDILLRHISRQDIERLINEKDIDILYMHRYDINNYSENDGYYYFSGIDAFFFNRTIIDTYKENGFMLGRPEWDHWFLYTAVKSGLRVCELKNKVAFHIKHEQRWSASTSNKMVMHQVNRNKTQNLGEEYYYISNNIMSELDNQIFIDGKMNSEIIKNGNFFQDKAIDENQSWQKQVNGVAGNIATAIIYYKNGKANRICAVHGEIVNCNDGTIKIGKILKEERERGIISQYIDFKDLNIFNKLTRVVIYPAGRAAKLLLDCLITYNVNVVGMVDRDPKLTGTKYMGKEVFGLDFFEKVDLYDQVIIASNLYVQQIYDSLSSIIEKEKIIVI